jgi:hypothetical protein
MAAAAPTWFLSCSDLGAPTGQAVSPPAKAATPSAGACSGSALASSPFSSPTSFPRQSNRRSTERPGRILDKLEHEGRDAGRPARAADGPFRTGALGHDPAQRRQDALRHRSQGRQGLG